MGNNIACNIWDRHNSNIQYMIIMKDIKRHKACSILKEIFDFFGKIKLQ